MWFPPWISYIDLFAMYFIARETETLDKRLQIYLKTLCLAKTLQKNERLKPTLVESGCSVFFWVPDVKMIKEFQGMITGNEAREIPAASSLQASLIIILPHLFFTYDSRQRILLAFEKNLKTWLCYSPWVCRGAHNHGLVYHYPTIITL